LPAFNNPSEDIFFKFDFSESFETLEKKIRVTLKRTRSRTVGTLHGEVFIFTISEEKCFRDKFWRNSKHRLQVQALSSKSCLVGNSEE
jgi:hypothetical protein